MHYSYLSFPFIGGLVGWLINRWLIGRLFRPYQAQKWGLVRQGIFPGNKGKIAEKLAGLAAAQFSMEPLIEKIKGPATIEGVMPVIEEHVDDFLRHKLKAQMPMIGMLIGDKTIGSLKTVFIAEIRNLFPEVLDKLTGSLEQELNIRQLVADKINAVSPDVFEEAVRSQLARPLRFIEIAGALGGFLIGLLLLLITWLAV